jgi:hypothetical protein
MRWLPAAILLASLSVPVAAASRAGRRLAVVTAARTLHDPDYKRHRSRGAMRGRWPLKRRRALANDRPSETKLWLAR